MPTFDPTEGYPGELHTDPGTPITYDIDPHVHPDPPTMWQRQEFSPTMPAPELMSLEEMMDIIDRRTTLATEPRIQAAERKLEEAQLGGQRTVNAADQAYQRALQDMNRQAQTEQQRGARSMAARGIYDSGLAQYLGRQISGKMQQLGYQLGEDHARVLADLAEYLHLQERHTLEEIQGIMGEKALMAQTMLDEMHQQQQTRRDALSQREFENWLAEQAFELNQWQANLDEYWRATNFDAARADAEWQQWFNTEQLRVAQEQAEWERIFAMNRWEAEQELQQLLVNNQISQQEFQNTLALDEFNLKAKMFEYEQRTNMFGALGNMNINLGNVGGNYGVPGKGIQNTYPQIGSMTHNNQPVGGTAPVPGSLHDKWGDNPWWKIY